EVPRSPLAGKPSQWYNDVRVIKNEPAVEVCEAKERLYVFDLARLRPVADGLDFFLRHREAGRGEVESEIFNRVRVELTFLRLRIQAVKPKPAKYLSDMLPVDNHADIQHIRKDSVDEALESSRGIGEAERHH
ncbi:hypothetical protein M404DRAFT_169923, partial [Pisolithus tinctorius Marx 270]